MPTYIFKATSRQGEVVVGERNAESRESLRSLLLGEQLRLTSAKEKGREISIPRIGRRGAKKVKAKELAIFTKQFSVMIDAGLPLVQCLDILSAQQTNQYFAQILNEVRSSVEEGETLSGALSKHPKVFDQLFVNMIDAGETGGILDLILQRLSTYIEKIVKLRRDVVSAMIYPTAVITIAIGVIAVILIFVIPQFEMIFKGILGDEPLPLPTRIVVGFSNFLAGWGGLGILVSLIAFAIVLHRYYKTERGRFHVDSFLLTVPIIGTILRKIAVARFSRTLSTLLSSGVPILQALDITARTAGNVVVEQAVRRIRTGVERGESVVDSLKVSDVFPNMVAQMVGIGEQTGGLDAMLAKIADFFEEEVDAAISNLLTLIEPVMIGFLGVTIGSIVVAMYLPLFTLIGKLSQSGVGGPPH